MRETREKVTATDAWRRSDTESGTWRSDTQSGTWRFWHWNWCMTILTLKVGHDDDSDTQSGTWRRFFWHSKWDMTTILTLKVGHTISHTQKWDTTTILTLKSGTWRRSDTESGTWWRFWHSKVGQDSLTKQTEVLHQTPWMCVSNAHPKNPSTSCMLLWETKIMAIVRLCRRHFQLNRLDRRYTETRTNKPVRKTTQKQTYK